MRKRSFFNLFIQSTIMAAAAMVSGSGFAQNYPNRAITMVLTTPPGGGGDRVARIIADRLASRLGKPVIVENKPGATGAIAISQVQRAPADGHTLLFAFSSAVLIAPQLQKKTFDPLEDLTLVAIAAKFPFCLIANPKVKANNPVDLVNFAQKNPGKLNYGSNGEGSVPHLLTEFLKQKTKTDMVHIPFKGGSPANMALVSGDIDLYFDGVGSAKNYIENGRVKPIAVTGEKRSPVLPNVPTFKEAGIPDIDFYSWMGIFLQKGTPNNVTERLMAEISNILKDDSELKSYAKESGLMIPDDSPEVARTMLRREYSAWREVIGNLNLKRQ